MSAAHANDDVVPVMTEKSHETAPKELHKIVPCHVAFLSEYLFGGVRDLSHEAFAVLLVRDEHVIGYPRELSDLAPFVLAVFLPQVILDAFQ